MARPKSKGAYAPLAAQYYLDDAILEAGPEAELLYVRCLSFLASVSTDGFLTERQLKIVGIGLRNVSRRVDKLLEAGLLEARPGGFVARSWLKWNKSAAQTDRHLRNDRERKANATPTRTNATPTRTNATPTRTNATPTRTNATPTDHQSCDDRENEASKHKGKGDNSDRNESQFQTDSSPQLSTVQLSTVQLSTVQLKQTPAPTVLDGVETAVHSFDDFWAIWPRKEGKANAAKAWTKATRKETPELILAAAQAYVDHPHRPAKQFVPHASTWLNGERWNDGEPTAPDQPTKSMTRADENAAEYFRLYGSGDERTGSIQALDAGLS